MLRRVDSLVPSESSSNISKLSVHLVDERENNSNDAWEERYCKEADPYALALTSLR